MKTTPAEEAHKKSISLTKELINIHQAEVNRLEGMIFNLKQSLPFEPSKPPAIPRKKRRQKGPKGALGEAIIKVLSSSSPLNNRGIRKALDGAAYPHPVSSETVRKECVKLKAEGKIVSEGEGRGTKYLLKKPA